MKKIKIFVSRRLDINSTFIPNPLYVPVLCGAYREHSSSLFAGDNTGENISEKQPFYSELTVQYWAWKNADADYYGLCHYRRYLSFADKHYKTNEQNMVVEPVLSSGAVKRHNLADEARMRDMITQYDAVVSKSADVRRIATPKGDGFPKTVRELWEEHDRVFIHKEDLDLLMRLIKELYPKYLLAAQDYLSGCFHRGYNCYILSRPLFFEMCSFQFGVLSAMEKQIDTAAYTGNMKRTFGYMGEIMYGIFIHYLEQQKDYRIHTLQLVYFEETRTAKNKAHQLWICALAWLTSICRHSSEFILPKGTARREGVKSFMKRLRGLGH